MRSWRPERPPQAACTSCRSGGVHAAQTFKAGYNPPRAPSHLHRSLFGFQAILLAAAVLGIPAPAFPQARVVISQVYGGGGNSGSVYTNDFVELFNAGDQAQDLAGWSVQYSSATGVGAWQATPLSGTIQPGLYFLIPEAAGTGGTTSLPSPDFAAGSIAMSATAGKIALLSGLAALSGACPTGATDFVGYGAVNCSEGSAAGATPAPALTNATAGFRAGQGCTDRDQNSLDFTASSREVLPSLASSSFPLAPCMRI